MSSALKPVLTPPAAQNPAAPPSKPSVSVHPHPQSSPATFSQSQPQSYGNPNNHEWLNVPNASQHFGGGQAGSAAFGGPKPATGYGSGFQPNLGHPPNQNSLPPVSQSLPATQAQPAPPTPKTPEADKPQSNGTADVKQTQDAQANHVPVEKQPPPVVPEIQKADKPDVNPAPAPEPKEQPEPAKPVEKITVTGPQPAEVPPVDQAVLSASVPVPTITVSPAKVPPVQVVTPVVQTVEKSQTENQSKESNSSCSSSSGSSPEVSPKVSTKSPEVAGNLSSEVVNKSSEEIKEVKEKKPENVPVEAAKTAVVPAPVSAPQSSESTSESVAALKETEQSPQASKPQSQTSKLALIRTPSARKSKAPETESPKSSTKQEVSTAKVTPVMKTPSGKSKRIRTRTQPYQSPLPEIEIITKITSSTSRKSRSSDDKLIVFYKNEFLAVRNSEGSFYICQAVQNIYKSSLKLKIRWLSQDKDEKSGEIYTPDFYDVTDFDCILTNLNLERVDKGKYRLPPAEKERTDSILNRSLAAEKGEVEPPSLTEEHPDGLDLSLYKDEGQLKKRKGTKRKKNSSPGRKPAKKKLVAPAPEPTAAKVSKPPVSSSSSSRKKIPARKPFALTVRKSTEVKKAPVPAAISSRSDRAKRRSAETQVKSKGSPVVDQKKAKVIAKMVKKSGISAAVAAPAGKSQANTRSVKSSKTVVPPPKAPTKVAVSAKPSGRVSKRSSRK